MGKLAHQVAFKGGNVRPFIRRDVPTMNEAVKAGFQFYENNGDGTLSRIAGDKGPKTLHANKLKK